jgi:hypothetical protein
MLRRSLLASLTLAAFTIVLGLYADEPTKGGKDTKQTPGITFDKNGMPIIASGAIAEQERKLGEKFSEFTKALLILQQRLANSSDPKDREQAKVLESALEKAELTDVLRNFQKLSKFLTEAKATSGDADKVVNVAKKILESLKELKDILTSDSAASDKKAERLALEKSLKELEKVIRDQKIVNQGTRDENSDKKQVADNQADTRDNTGKVVDGLKGKDGKGQGGEAKDLKGTAKEGGKGDKGDTKKDPQGGEGAKSGDSKDGGKGDGKKGDAKKTDGDGKGGEKGGSKDGKGADASKAGGSKDGKGADSKDGKAGDSKDGKGAEGGQAGDSKKGGQPGDAKGGDKSGDKKDNPGGSKKDSGGEASKAGDSKKGGDSPKSGDPSSSKSGGEGSKSDGQGKAKSGSESKGQSSSKGGGQSQQDQQAGGGKSDNMPPQPSNPKDDVATMKKKIQDAIEHQKQLEEEIMKGKRPEAEKEGDQALKDLQDAKKKLEDLIRQLREEELERVLTALINRCQKMLAMQEEVLRGTLRLQTQMGDRPPDRAEREHKQTGIILSDDEEKIVHEASKAIEMLETEGSAVAFPEVFQQVREDMKHVKRRLGNTDAGDVTVTIEQDICDTLREMIKALEKAKKDLDDKKNPPKPSDGPPPPPQDQKLLEKIAELKMLKAMQLRVNSRTELYGRRYPGEVPQDPTIRDELRELSDRQDRILEVTRKMVKGQ